MFFGHNIKKYLVTISFLSLWFFPILIFAQTPSLTETVSTKINNISDYFSILNQDIQFKTGDTKHIKQIANVSFGLPNLIKKGYCKTLVFIGMKCNTEESNVVENVNQINNNSEQKNNEINSFIKENNIIISNNTPENKINKLFINNGVGYEYLDARLKFLREDILSKININKTRSSSGGGVSLGTVENVADNLRDSINEVEESLALSNFTTDNLAEGIINLYFTNARARSALSSSATGLTYNNITGDFSLTSGYVIPTTASTTDWDTAYGWGDHTTAGYMPQTYLDTDGVFLANSDTKVPSQKAVKTYVDNKALGLVWHPAVELINVVSEANTPPLSPVHLDGYFIQTGGNVGDWSSFNPGDLVQYQTNQWVLIKSMTIGDRFGIAFKTSTTPDESFAGKKNYMAEITGGSAGAYTYTFEAAENNDAVFVSNSNAFYNNVSFTYSSHLGIWVQLSATVDWQLGNGLDQTGKIASLGPLTSNWNQTGSFNISLNNSSAGLQILENGASPTFFGSFDVADLSSDQTYTFPNASGTVITTGNIADITGLTTSNFATTSVSQFVNDSNFISDISSFDTDDLTEGITNLYSQWSTSASDIYYTDGNVGIGTSTSLTSKLTVNGAFSQIGAGTNFLGRNAGTGTVSVELGSGRTGDGATFIDFTGDTTYTDYGLRISRLGTGADANSTINHRGTGALTLSARDAGKITFETNNSERMRLDADGNLGLGLLVPSAKLHIATTTEQLRIGYDNSNYLSTTIGSTGGVTLDSVGAGQGFTFSDNVTASSFIRSGGLSTQFLKADGSVDSSTYLTSASALDATNISAGTLAVARGGTGQTTYTNGQLLIGNTTGNTLTKATLTGTTNQITVTNGAGSITLSTPQSINTGAAPQFARIGLGAAADAASPLNAIRSQSGASTIAIFNNNNSAVVNNSARISFRANRGTVTSTDTGYIDGMITDIGASSYKGALVFYTSNNATPAERMRIDYLGNLGIGTGATISARLHSLSTTEQLRLGYDASNYLSTTVGSTGGVTLDAVGAGAGFTFSDNLSVTGTGQFTAVGSGAYAFDLNLTADGTLTTSASDKRLKENITTLNSAETLEKIMKLNPAAFDWKSNGSHDIGLIAQEVEQVFPEIVFTNEADGYKGINYSRIPALLIAAVQEIAHKVEKMFTWFGENRFNVQGEICVDDVCISKEQFKILIQNNGAHTSPSSNASSVVETSINTQTNTDTAAETPVSPETPLGVDSESIAPTAIETPTTSTEAPVEAPTSPEAPSTDPSPAQETSSDAPVSGDSI